MDFTTKLNHTVARIEQALDLLVPAWPGPERGPTRLHAAMRYSLQAGGKRLRPVFTIAVTELLTPLSSPRGLSADPLPAAVAIECLHTYSLIHDDLPCMDNDDLRRGRPTVHRQFDEATALLAGDALLTHAFTLLATHYAADPSLATRLIRGLADAGGSARLIGGQMQDLLTERQPGTTAAELDYIHQQKTAALLEFSWLAGGLLASASDPVLSTLQQAGHHLGLAFQIIDDLLDATADTATLGKTAGKDARAGKATYVSLHGLDAARTAATTHTQAAVAAIEALPGDTRFLAALAASLLHRQR